MKVVVLDNALARHGPPAAGHVLGRPPQAVDLGATPDWPALARSFGIAGYDGDLAAALAEPGPALLRIAIEPEDDCLPMFSRRAGRAGDDRVHQSVNNYGVAHALT